MKLFSELISSGDTVVEIGGHIGFITQYFSHLVGTEGKVLVFEPGDNNLPYLRTNTGKLTNVSLIEKAVSDFDGTVHFYLEDLTGQNNSILKDYGAFAQNEKAANTKAKKETREVESIRIDSFLRDAASFPTFIKIDIEGAELPALQGMSNLLLTNPPILMVEVTENHKQVADFLCKLGYCLYSPDSRIQFDRDQVSGNVFCLHSTTHQKQIRACFKN
jgi:FkbM family methyltransferase